MFLPATPLRKFLTARWVRPRFLLVPAFVLLAALPAGAQTAEQVDSILNRIEWRNIGPAIMGGRIDDVAVVESDTKVMWIATASAGVWKTENHGTTWIPQFQNEEVVLHWIHRGGGLRPLGGLGGDRGAREPAEQFVGQRGLCLHGRRSDLVAPGTRKHPPHRPDPGAPHRSRHRVRRRPRPSLGAQRGARRVPHPGRRRDLGPGAPPR